MIKFIRRIFFSRPVTLHKPKIQHFRPGRSSAKAIPHACSSPLLVFPKKTSRRCCVLCTSIEAMQNTSNSTKRILASQIVKFYCLGTIIADRDRNDTWAVPLATVKRFVLLVSDRSFPCNWLKQWCCHLYTDKTLNLY